MRPVAWPVRNAGASPTRRISFQTSSRLFGSSETIAGCTPTHVQSACSKITRRDGADRALRLSQNQIRPQLAQAINIDAINREALGHDLFHALIDLVGGSVNGNFRGAANRQRFDARRKVAFVGAADEMIGEAERSDDLGRARQQGNDARMNHFESYAFANSRHLPSQVLHKTDNSSFNATRAHEPDKINETD